MSFRLVPNSVTLDDLERRNSPNGRVISPNSVGFGAPSDPQRGLCPLHPRWGHSFQTPYVGLHTPGGAPFPSIPISPLGTVQRS